MAIRISWVLLVWMPVCLPAHPAIGAPSGVPRASATVADWRAAIDAIVSDIRLLHPDPFTRVGRTTFLRQAEALKVALPSLTPEQRVVGAMRMVATLGDGHTQLEPIDPAFAHWYPIRLYEFTDGYFVTSAHESVADLAGAQVLEIAGRPVAEVVDAARDLMGADNAFGRMERLYVVHSAGLMKGLGFAGGDGELAVKVKLRDGRIARRLPAPEQGGPSRLPARRRHLRVAVPLRDLRAPLRHRRRLAERLPEHPLQRVQEARPRAPAPAHRPVAVRCSRPSRARRVLHPHEPGERYRLRSVLPNGVARGRQSSRAG